MTDATNFARRSLTATGDMMSDRTGRAQTKSTGTNADDGAERDPRMELLSRLAAVPLRRGTVEGSAPRKGASHIAGAARVAGAAVKPATPIAAKPTGTTVALADGTRITFAAVEVE